MLDAFERLGFAAEAQESFALQIQDVLLGHKMKRSQIAAAQNMGELAANLLVMLAEPVVIMRVNVMAAPKAGREKLFELLLKLNATDMSHGAYALDGNNLIIIDTLEMDTMDLQEFEASIDAIGVALAQHLRILSAYHAKA